MRLTIGAIVVFACVFGSYAAMGGHLEVLWQPFEFVIILGAAIGAFIIGNTGSVLKAVPAMLGTMVRGPRYRQQSYVELLGMQYSLYKLVKQKGMMALEPHIENPSESTLFNAFPTFAANDHAVEFVCDYMRMLMLGANNAYEIEALMDEELETHHEEQEQVVSSMQALADGTPALGIVAAVLGVIKTMGAIKEPPEVLGHLIGGALVGTFFGVFVAYGFFGPMAQSLKSLLKAESKYYLSLKVGLIAHISGQPPVMSVEFARKALMSDVRPTFNEVETATAALPA
ncbi:flagellar motor stator protein MotA [Methylobacterium sp. Leaf104]|uniref:flagellar motor stator protein MotA n=1 Tax=Methylobacterium TaxID=407 RepID=UPI0006F41FF6|nr:MULTISPECIES: flagellar motor stator protein MotA [Methylobacterium]KQP29977.1 flagellar motor stator protein MotA [Methylobacterium sp. Leaf104]MCI9882322.1 flagellar motor stator protein MotA [Methylobacterium goesingense]